MGTLNFELGSLNFESNPAQKPYAPEVPRATAHSRKRCRTRHHTELWDLTVHGQMAGHDSVEEVERGVGRGEMDRVREVCCWGRERA